MLASKIFVAADWTASRFFVDVINEPIRDTSIRQNDEPESEYTRAGIVSDPH